MSFSDEDLRVAKNYIASDPLGEFRCDEIKALLSRLEAAERVASTPPECNCSQECDWHSEAIRAWKKERGK